MANLQTPSQPLSRREELMTVLGKEDLVRLGEDGQRPGKREFSLLEVGAAVSRQLSLPPELHEIVGLAGRLHTYVNQDPGLRASGLDGSAFRNLLLTNLSPEIARMLDPAQAAKIRAEQDMLKANPAGAEGMRAVLGFGRIVNGVLVASTGKDANTAHSSTAFGDLPGNWTIQKLQRYAADHGVGWVANNPDLLRLGPSAIDAIAKAGLTAKTYEFATKKAFFMPKEVVTLAKHGFRDEDIGTVARGVHKLANGNPEVARRLDNAITAAVTNSNDPKVDEKLDKVLGDDPTAKAIKAKVREVQAREQVARNTNQTATAQAISARQTERSEKDELAAFLASPATATTPSSPAVDKSSPAKPEVKVGPGVQAAGKTAPKP